MRRGAKTQFLYDERALVADQERSIREWMDLGDNLTPNRGSVPSKFREMVVMKFKCHGINLKSLVELLFFI